MKKPKVHAECAVGSPTKVKDCADTPLVGPQVKQKVPDGEPNRASKLCLRAQVNSMHLLVDTDISNMRPEGKFCIRAGQCDQGDPLWLRPSSVSVCVMPRWRFE